MTSPVAWSDGIALLESALTSSHAKFVEFDVSLPQAHGVDIDGVTNVTRSVHLTKDLLKQIVKSPLDAAAREIAAAIGALMQLAAKGIASLEAERMRYNGKGAAHLLQWFKMAMRHVGRESDDRKLITFLCQWSDPQFLALKPLATAPPHIVDLTMDGDDNAAAKEVGRAESKPVTIADDSDLEHDDARGKAVRVASVPAAASARGSASATGGRNSLPKPAAGADRRRANRGSLRSRVRTEPTEAQADHRDDDTLLVSNVDQKRAALNAALLAYNASGTSRERVVLTQHTLCSVMEDILCGITTQDLEHLRDLANMKGAPPDGSIKDPTVMDTAVRSLIAILRDASVEALHQKYVKATWSVDDIDLSPFRFKQEDLSHSELAILAAVLYYIYDKSCPAIFVRVRAKRSDLDGNFQVHTVRRYEDTWVITTPETHRASMAIKQEVSFADAKPGKRRPSRIRRHTTPAPRYDGVDGYDESLSDEPDVGLESAEPSSAQALGDARKQARTAFPNAATPYSGLVASGSEAPQAENMAQIAAGLSAMPTTVKSVFTTPLPSLAAFAPPIQADVSPVLLDEAAAAAASEIITSHVAPPPPPSEDVTH